MSESKRQDWIDFQTILSSMLGIALFLIAAFAIRRGIRTGVWQEIAIGVAIIVIEVFGVIRFVRSRLNSNS